MKPSPWLVVVLVGALAGLGFSSVSTYDFVQHLDRQVHSLHCSFIPGGHADTGASGCQAAMMSPYSSVLRTSIWGGIPIALGAMGVFAFILFYGLDLLVTRRKADPRATALLAVAAGLPAATSIVMLIISLTKLGTTCKLCVGVYIASALCLVGAITLWRQAVAARATLPDSVGASKNGASLLEVQVEAPATSTRFLGAMFGIGVAFVAAPTALYAAMAPDHGRFIGTCGTLEQPADTYNVMVPIHRGGEASAIEILDPLCPACKAFEARLESSGFADRLDRKAIMFPLDTTCNWMITDNTHPGACTVSEAVLCAGERAPEVLAWAFEVQDRIRAETKVDPAAAARIVAKRFPELASCIGSPEARSRLNKSLRWAVANNIRVLTPQLYVNGTKLCDEDVDLGLDYALSRMIGRAAPPVQTSKPVDASTPPAETPSPSATHPAPTAASSPTTAPTGPVTAPSAATEPSAPGAAPTHATSPTAPATAPTDKPGTAATDKPADPLPAEAPPPTRAPAASAPATPPAPAAPTPPAPADKPVAKSTDNAADKPAAPADTTGGAP